MSKKMFFGVLCAVFVSGLLIAGINFNVTKAVAYSSSGTSVIGIIGENTTWTKENSPYNLTGPVLVNATVTLTIEPGVIVNLNSYYIRVYGSLIARGNSTDTICFNGGQITGVNCIIENSILNSTSTQGAKSLINNIIINAEVEGGSIISNTIISAKVSGSPIISNTIINGEISVMLGTGVVISNNTITNPEGSGISCNGYAYISDNVIYGCKTGINAYTITLIIGGDAPAYPTIERNLILNNNVGITIDLYRRFEPGTLCPTIVNNTISKNSIGIYLRESNYAAAPTILYNDIQNNSNYNFYLQASVNVNATYNWWGTTDIPSINQTIYDFKNDFNLGTVNFIPFLTAPNPAAPTLDKTAPSVGIPSHIPEGDVQPGQEVKISVNATDTLSNIKNVTLSYNLNNGNVWVNLPMTYNSTTGLYETAIQIQQANTLVKYKIIAYDNAGNYKVEDNSGEYYIYTVIPEFPLLIILPLYMVTTLLVVIVYKRKHTM